MYVHRFDRGPLLNLLEFLQIPGYAVDYRTVFDIPNAEVVTAMSSSNVVTCSNPAANTATTSKSNMASGNAGAVASSNNSTNPSRKSSRSPSSSPNTSPTTSTDATISASQIMSSLRSQEPPPRPKSGSNLSIPGTIRSTSGIIEPSELTGPGIVRSSSDTAVTVSRNATLVDVASNKMHRTYTTNHHAHRSIDNNTSNHGSESGVGDRATSCNSNDGLVTELASTQATL